MTTDPQTRAAESIDEEHGTSAPDELRTAYDESRQLIKIQKDLLGKLRSTVMTAITDREDQRVHAESCDRCGRDHMNELYEATIAADKAYAKAFPATADGPARPGQLPDVGNGTHYLWNQAATAVDTLTQVREALASFDGRGIITTDHINVDIPTASEVIDAVRVALGDHNTEPNWVCQGCTALVPFSQIHVHRHTELKAAHDRVEERCQQVRDREGPSGMINASQILGLLSPTWPDGNHEAAPPDTAPNEQYRFATTWSEYDAGRRAALAERIQDQS